MKTTIYVLISAVVTATSVILLQDYTSIDEVLKDVQGWYNSNVAFANTSGIVSSVIAIIFAYFASKAKETEREIKIDVNDSTKKIDSQNELLTKLTNNVANLQPLVDLLLIFATNTNINNDAKKQITDLYSDIKNNLNDLSEDNKTLIQEVISNTKDAITESIEHTEDIKQTSTSILDKYREQAKE